MNLWIAKIGRNNFSKTNLLKLESITCTYKTIDSKTPFQFKADGIHFLSFHTSSEKTQKEYTFIKNRELFGYSGLLIDKNNSAHSFCKAADIKDLIKRPEIALNLVDGQYACVSSGDNYFRVFTDALGMHKVFYSQTDEALYVSNSVPCIQAVDKKNLNIDFYIDFIAGRGTYGYQTEDANIQALPEYGLLEWNRGKGVEVSTYSNLLSLMKPDGEMNQYLQLTASQWRSATEYLTKNHKSVLTLSGGYDSRLILDFFSKKSFDNLFTYTYADSPMDAELACKIAESFKVPHKMLKPSMNLDFDQILEFAIDGRKPFYCLSNVFGYQYRSQVVDIFDGELRVLLKGDGGDTQAGLKRYNKNDKNSPENAIETLVNSSFKYSVLSPEVKEKAKDRMHSYYSEKYLDVLESGRAYNLGSYFYFLERFGNYQSHKLINTGKLSDYYMPYANQNFLKTVFTASKRELFKSKRNSIHHQLNHLFANTNQKKIDYSAAVHWDANKLYRIFYRLRDRHLIKSGENSSFSEVIRNRFFEENKYRIQEVILTSGSAGLWHYFDKETVFDWANNIESTNRSERKIMFRIVPLIIAEFS